MTRTWLACSLLLLLSCKGAESTGPSSQPMTLTFEPATVTMSGVVQTSGLLRCELDLKILAHGNSDHRLSLKSIAATFTIDGVTNLPAIMTPTTWFGVSSLKRDEQAITHRIPTAQGPFVFISTVAYVDQFGATRTATSTVNCIY